MFAPQYPDVNFIVPHLGSFADDWRAQLTLIDHLARHPNLHADTAGVHSTNRNLGRETDDSYAIKAELAPAPGREGQVAACHFKD